MKGIRFKKFKHLLTYFRQDGTFTYSSMCHIFIHSDVGQDFINMLRDHPTIASEKSVRIKELFLQIELENEIKIFENPTHRNDYLMKKAFLSRTADSEEFEYEFNDIKPL